MEKGVELALMTAVTGLLIEIPHVDVHPFIVDFFFLSNGGLEFSVFLLLHDWRLMVLIVVGVCLIDFCFGFSLEG